MAEALGAAAKLFLVPAHLGMMLLGVLAGLVVGVLPGMGGIVAVAVLLPFVVRLGAIAAPALLTGPPPAPGGQGAGGRRPPPPPFPSGGPLGGRGGGLCPPGPPGRWCSRSARP